MRFALTALLTVLRRILFRAGGRYYVIGRIECRSRRLVPLSVFLTDAAPPGGITVNFRAAIIRNSQLLRKCLYTRRVDSAVVCRACRSLLRERRSQRDRHSDLPGPADRPGFGCSFRTDGADDSKRVDLNVMASLSFASPNAVTLSVDPITRRLRVYRRRRLFRRGEPRRLCPSRA